MSPSDRERFRRRSIRLPGYDYTQPGAYFITIVTHERAPLFGRVVDGCMRLNASGEIVHEEWFKTAELRPYVRLDNDGFVIMPNHVHGIIWIVGDDAIVGAQRRCAPTIRTTPTFPAPTIPTVPMLRAPVIRTTPTGGVPETAAPTRPNVVSGSIGAIVRAFKSATTRRIHALHATPGEPVWQRNYYEHIIRHEDALRRITQYIQTNPERWGFDWENPERLGTDEFDMWIGKYGRGDTSPPDPLPR